MIAANAGLVTKTPNDTPNMVVIAKPRTKPAPALQSGSIATRVVKYAAIMMKNARLIRSFQLSIADDVLC